jgi:hypothetical protein
VIERLGPESRALVDAAREGLGPDDVAVRRMRGRIATAVASGAAVGGLAAGAHTATAASTTSSLAAGSVAAKLAVVAVVAAGTAVGTRAVITHRATPRPAVVQVAPAPAVHVALPLSPPPPRADVVEPIVVDSPLPAPPPPRAHVHTQVAAVAPVPSIARPSLARETELLDAALDAAAHSHFADAIAAIGRYRDATAGHGQLAEDADAIEIEALCRLDDARSGAAFTAFTARWPHAHDIGRLSAVCRR